ncbi:MAG: SPFH domain-containing protein [Halococcoides sp.]
MSGIGPLAGLVLGGLGAWLSNPLVWGLALIVGFGTLWAAFTPVRTSDRAVVWRSGEIDRVLDTGVHLTAPLITRAESFDLRSHLFELRDHRVTTADGQALSVDADVYVRIDDVERAARARRSHTDDDREIDALAAEALERTVEHLDADEATVEVQKIVYGVCDRLERALDDRGRVVDDVDVIAVAEASAEAPSTDEAMSTDAA